MHVLKKPKETDSMLMLDNDNECHNQLGFQLDTYGMDLSNYTFIDYYYSVIHTIIIFSIKISENCSALEKFTVGHRLQIP
jgi:hypothetical protein